MGVQNAPKSIKNGIKNNSEIETKTAPRPPRSDPLAGSPGGPLGGSHFRAWSSKRNKDEGDRAENDEGTKGKEQKMTNGPRGKSRKSRKTTNGPRGKSRKSRKKTKEPRGTKSVWLSDTPWARGPANFFVSFSKFRF